MVTVYIFKTQRLRENIYASSSINTSIFIHDYGEFLVARRREKANYL